MRSLRELCLLRSLYQGRVPPEVLESHGYVPIPSADTGYRNLFGAEAWIGEVTGISFASCGMIFYADQDDDEHGIFNYLSRHYDHD